MPVSLPVECLLISDQRPLDVVGFSLMPPPGIDELVLLEGAVAPLKLDGRCYLRSETATQHLPLSPSLSLSLLTVALEHGKTRSHEHAPFDLSQGFRRRAAARSIADHTPLTAVLQGVRHLR